MGRGGSQGNGDVLDGVFGFYLKMSKSGEIHGQKDVILLHKVLFSSVHTSKYYTIGTCEPHLQSSLYTNFLKFVKGWRLLWNVGLGCRIISKMPWLTFCQQQPCSSVTLCVCPVSRLGLIPWDHMCSFLFPPTLSLFWSFEQAPSEQSF